MSGKPPPRPWRFYHAVASPDGSYFEVFGPKTPGGDRIVVDSFADACLIGAARDLLDAAERILRIIGGDPDRPDYAETVNDLAAAVCRARGES